MAPKRGGGGGGLAGLYPQRKSSISGGAAAGHGKIDSAKKDDKALSGAAPAPKKPSLALVDAINGASTNLKAPLASFTNDDDYDEVEDILREFDTNMQYGPCLGMARIDRWNRAQGMGLNPPLEIKEVLERAGGAPSCLWEGRV